MNTKLIIFDMDGTLFRTETVDIIAINKALSDNGYKTRKGNEILKLIGPTLDEICDILLGEVKDDLKTKFFADVIKYELEEIEKSGELYEGVVDLMENLKSKGFTLCICSNGSQKYIDKIIQKFCLNQYFHEIWSQTDGITKSEAIGILKYKFDADSFIMIGDRAYDLDAAKENGGISIGVTYGFGKDEVLCADYTCDRLEEIEGIINQLNIKERI
jgi:phosphoglycolate phosphatase